MQSGKQLYDKIMGVYQQSVVVSVDQTAYDWPEPEPLREALAEVGPLPIANIPVPYRDWIADVAERMQCPPDFVAVAAIVATASIIGTSCGIKPKQHDDWLVIPNIWGGIVGRPGMLKTPAVSEVMQLVGQLEKEAKQSFDTANISYQADLELYKADKEAIKSALLSSRKKSLDNKLGQDGYDALSLREKLIQSKEPEKPVWKRYKTNDATIEKLSELLADNPRGLLLYRDELVGLLSTWDKEGRECDRAFFLEAWNGDGSLTTDRITRGTVHTENVCLSIFGNTQPAKLAHYLYEAMHGSNNDGLLQRFQLLIYPDEVKNWQLIDRQPNREAKQRVSDVFKRLATMNPVEYGAIKEAHDRYPYVRFDEAAQDLFNDWLVKLETEKLQADDPPILLEHLAKYRSLVPSLALIFHLIDAADGIKRSAVSFESVLNAISWASYLELHARRIYGMATNVVMQAARRLSKKIQDGDLRSPFSLRDIYRREWTGLEDKDLVRSACDELIEAGWLCQECQPKGIGRPKSPVYLINPKVKIRKQAEETFP